MARETIFIMPKAGMKVRDPRTQDVLPAAGKRVEKNSYWSRRLLEGCVQEVKKSESKRINKTGAKK